MCVWFSKCHDWRSTQKCPTAYYHDTMVYNVRKVHIFLVRGLKAEVTLSLLRIVTREKECSFRQVKRFLDYEILKNGICKDQILYAVEQNWFEFLFGLILF